MNQILEDSLRMCTIDFGGSWKDHFPLIVPLFIMGGVELSLEQSFTVRYMLPSNDMRGENQLDVVTCLSYLSITMGFGFMRNASIILPWREYYCTCPSISG